MKLKDKVVIIIGGVSGIGEFIVCFFIEEGVKVVIVDFFECGKELLDELNVYGYNMLFIKIDVIKEVDIKQLIYEIVSIYGKLDIMYVNVGVVDDVLVNELFYEKWKRIIDINLFGVFFFDKYLIE